MVHAHTVQLAHQGEQGRRGPCGGRGGGGAGGVRGGWGCEGVAAAAPWTRASVPFTGGSGTANKGQNMTGLTGFTVPP